MLREGNGEPATLAQRCLMKFGTIPHPGFAGDWMEENALCLGDYLVAQAMRDGQTTTINFCSNGIGDGSGDGSGYGSGDGYGDGDGSGDGDGYGDGSGYGNCG